MSIGSRIKERREEIGMTQTQLAEMIGVTKGAIGNYESDANSPKASIMYKVFKALRCDANYLYQDMIEAPESTMLPQEERTLLKLFRELNEDGQGELLNHADTLVQSRKYIKSDNVFMEKDA